MQTSTTTPPDSVVWDQTRLQNPHAQADKCKLVKQMFTAIAPCYDLNNRLHSLWLDQHWRNVAVKKANLNPGDKVCDIACGTGDLTLKFAARLAKLNPQSASTEKVLGIDFTYNMLPLAVQKSTTSPVPALYANGDAMNLPLPDQCMDVASIAFGIRNVADPAVAITEFYRILKPGGRLVILEFSLPTNRIMRSLYNFYFNRIIPTTATWISRDKTGAYKYLPKSVNTFIDRQAMATMMTRAGFQKVNLFPMTFGVCVCYVGVRP